MHKAGSRVRCPKCDSVIQIPTREETAALSAMAGISSPGTITEAAGFVFEQEGPPPAPREGFPIEPQAQPVLQTREVPPAETHLVAVSRGVIYAQGVLLAVVAVLAFAIGYLVGGGGEKGARKSSSAIAEPDVGPARVTGRIVYETADGQPTADSGAVVIVVPAGRFPDESIPIEGIRATDPPAGDEHAAVRAIHSLGGHYLRADVEGQIDFAVAEPGRYHVLCISNHVQRPGSQSPSPSDLEAVGNIFAPAPALLGEQKYAWETRDLADGSNVDHNFGPSGA